MKMIKLLKQVLMAVFVVGLVAVFAGAEPTLEKAEKSYFDQEGKVLIDFEDAEFYPGLQYWDSHGVKFVDTGKATTIRIDSYNRDGAETASGEYSIFSRGNYPQTSSQVPLNLVFKEGVSAAGFYAGNGNIYGEQVTATITAYGKKGQVLGTMARSDIGDPVTTFIGVKSSEPIYKISVDYGNSYLGEELDDVMFVKANEVGGGPVSGEPSGKAVKFKVEVNDYPEHKDYSKAKSLPNAYAVMYKVKLEGEAFKITGWTALTTGADGVATFEVKLGEMVYFEGFKSWKGVEEGAKAKKAISWTTPPYKNFGVFGKLCQTHYTETDEFLQYDSDYACTASLSIPYLDISGGEKLPDLGLVEIGFGETSFRAKVCNKGTKDAAGFKIMFQAKGKTNVLTYMPGLAMGKCANIYSWGYEQFGLGSGETASLMVEVDPYNKVEELQEDNNKLWSRPRTIPGEKVEDGELEEVTGGGGVVEGGKTEEGGGAVLPTTPAAFPAVKCISGCNFEGKCLPVGTRLNNFYCSWSGDKFRQQPVGTACENNYECNTNSCISGKCLDLEKQLEEQKNLLKKILDWLAELFGRR